MIWKTRKIMVLFSIKNSDLFLENANIFMFVFSSSLKKTHPVWIRSILNQLYYLHYMKSISNHSAVPTCNQSSFRLLLSQSQHPCSAPSAASIGFCLLFCFNFLIFFFSFYVVTFCFIVLASFKVYSCFPPPQPSLGKIPFLLGPLWK